MAIYTTLSKKDIAKLVDEFALGDLISFSGIRTGSVNTHYLIETKRAKFFAKVDEVKSELEVKQELDLLLHLRKQNFPCLQPLKTKSGRYHLEFQEKCVTVTRHLDGVELPVETMNADTLEHARTCSCQSAFDRPKLQKRHRQPLRVQPHRRDLSRCAAADAVTPKKYRTGFRRRVFLPGKLSR